MPRQPTSQDLPIQSQTPLTASAASSSTAPTSPDTTDIASFKPTTTPSPNSLNDSSHANSPDSAPLQQTSNPSSSPSPVIDLTFETTPPPSSKHFLIDLSSETTPPTPNRAPLPLNQPKQLRIVNRMLVKENGSSMIRLHPGQSPHAGIVAHC